MPNLVEMANEEAEEHLRAIAIAGKNDAFRSRMDGRGGSTDPEGRWLLTAKGDDKGPAFAMEAARKIPDLTIEDWLAAQGRDPAPLGALCP